jgi:hypothetical protein
MGRRDTPTAVALPVMVHRDTLPTTTLRMERYGGTIRHAVTPAQPTQCQGILLQLLYRVTQVLRRQRQPGVMHKCFC